MILNLTQTREQAFLAMVIQEAGNVLTQQNGYLGRTAIQKILYFAQALGVPVRYRFDVYHYGPFCSDILSDVDSLVLEDVIADKSANPSRYSNYRIGPESERLFGDFHSEIEPHRETVRSIVKALVPLSPDHLELIATLHYAYRELRATRQTKPTAAEVANRFRQFKGDKFDDGAISTAFDQLRTAGLC